MIKGKGCSHSQWVCGEGAVTESTCTGNGITGVECYSEERRVPIYCPVNRKSV